MANNGGIWWVEHGLTTSNASSNGAPSTQHITTYWKGPAEVGDADLQRLATLGANRDTTILGDTLKYQRPIVEQRMCQSSGMILNWGVLCRLLGCLFEGKKLTQILINGDKEATISCLQSESVST